MKVNFEKLADFGFNSMVWIWLASVPAFIIGGIKYFLKHDNYSHFTIAGISLIMAGLIFMILTMLLSQAAEQVHEAISKRKK